MPTSSESGESRSIEAGSIRLNFQWVGQSWTHWIEVDEPNAAKPHVLALALEGDPERDDPSRVVSPAYQQIHFQEDGATIQALLVGQSGPHHFSAVFDFKEDGPGDVRIGVDVADRCRGPIEFLASTYTIDARSDELVEASPSLAAWDFGAGRLTFEAVAPAQVALAEAGRRTTRIQALAGLDKDQATRRFRYTWHWLPTRRG